MRKRGNQIAQHIEREIFFHVGIAKTGTTFLQDRVFPEFEGIWYIGRNRYHRAIKIIRRSRAPRILVSYEFDLHFEKAMEKFGAVFPRTTPVIVLRHHASYIASQYRRFIKNGFRGSFRDFFDMENDKGLFKKKDLEFMRFIRILEETFRPDPVVLFYDDLSRDPERFIIDLAKRIGATVDIQRINLKKKHTSFTEKQLRAVRWVGRFINLKVVESCPTRLIRFFCRLPKNMVRYPVLWLSKYLPDSLFSSEPLIPPEELEKIREYYKEDWQACRRYAEGR